MLVLGLDWHFLICSIAFGSGIRIECLFAFDAIM